MKGSFLCKSELMHQIIHKVRTLLDIKGAGDISLGSKLYQRTHIAEKPWECKECRERFYQKTSFTLHQRICTGEKSFTVRSKKSFLLSQNSLYIREHRCPLNVNNAGKLSFASHNLLDIRDPRQVRSLMNMKNLGKPSTASHNS